MRKALKKLTINVIWCSIESVLLTLNINDWIMMKSKPTKRLCYEDFQYGSGDITVINERDSLHLYEAVDSVSCSKNLAREIFSFQKENIFANIHGKKI